MELAVKTKNIKDKIHKQAALLYWAKVSSNNLNIKVLAYIIRHSQNGMFRSSNGYAKDIAKLHNTSQQSVSNAMQTLQKNGFVRFVHKNGENSRTGYYCFTKAFEALTDKPNEITFKFI